MPSVPREKYPEMNWRAADKVAAWKVFKRRMEVIFVADQIPEERQWALILVAGGDEAYNRWDTLEDTVQDRKKVDQVWLAFEKSFEQSTSFWHFRDTYLGDFRQDESETTADLDLRIKQTVKGCQWQKESEEERMIGLLYHATIYYEIRKFVQESEEIAHELAGATVYTKADALKAFLQIHLTHEASLLTTFNSHRGRLRFLRMPFGAQMSQDVFQLRMDAILEQCPGVIGIRDDMVIFGVDQEDHDANLINLLNVCQKEGLVLNSKKLELRRERVTFFGAEYSAQGMHPDPKKVQGITEMTAPTDKQQLQSFLGMVNYMGTFIPNLSHHTEPLRAMLKKDNVFHWEDQQTRSFQQVKTLIAKANTTPLRYYDRDLPVTVQADASLRGLGACLIQKHKGKDQPIAFASKSLTDAETRYANIERELLAIVFACQRFSTYLLGRSFIAESDHKPLEMIAMKNLANAPPRLQRMLLELQRYDVTIKYRPGKEMQLADALSRCPARASQEIKLDMRVDYIAFTKPWIEKLKDSTQRDPILATVYQLTQQGWPHQRRHVPRMARRYWDFRDELSTDDGLLLKGPRLIIPGELQEEYLSRLHEGHLSANKVQENAKQHMYWTGIDADIEDYTKRCQECIKRSQVPKEPLQPHDIPEGPWRKLGMDYFAFDGNSYVLICDYFSKFPFLYRAKTSFWSLRDRLIDLFSIEGYPDEIVSDNGPPFQSKEFAKFLSGLGIKHTTSSPGYPRSNGFIERHIQTVKNMLSKSQIHGHFRKS